MKNKFAALKKKLTLDSQSQQELQNSMSIQMQFPFRSSQTLNLVKQGRRVSRYGILTQRGGQCITILPQQLQVRSIRGRGAAGVVQQAYHRPTGLLLALKSINVYDRQKRKQLMNDISALQNSDCPFLVKFYGAFFAEGQVKIALQLMDGGSVGDLVKKLQQPVIPQPVLAKMTQQILCGLMYLHRVKHQVHRDIKPANILVSSSGAVKLSDFGISKELGMTIGLCNTFLGTMIYMSPERIYGKKYSYSSDIWSLGLMLYQLATGKQPYPKANSYIEMIEFISSMPQPELGPSFSREFCEFFSFCVQKNPGERKTAIQLSAHPWVLKYSMMEVRVDRWIENCIKSNAS